MESMDVAADSQPILLSYEQLANKMVVQGWPGITATSRHSGRPLGLRGAAHQAGAVAGLSSSIPSFTPPINTSKSSHTPAISDTSRAR
jgi:hypothetical protein